MKIISVIFSLLIGLGLAIAVIVLIGSAAEAVGFSASSIPQGIDAATAAVDAYPSEEVGHLIARYLIMLAHIEWDKLMFWVHLFN